MKDLDKIVFGFIFSAIGIILGWILNQLSSWFRARQEDKKNLKFVLFNLLETYRLFLLSDLEKYISKLTEKVFQKMPYQQQTEQMKIFINTLYSDIFENHFKPEIFDNLKKIESQYQDSILTLAKIDPITAYYLSGKTSLVERFEIIEKWFEEIKTNYPIDTKDIEISKRQVKNIVKPNLIKEIVTDVEGEIKKISWKININTWFKTRKVLIKIKNNANKSIDNYIDGFFSNINTLI